MRRRPRRRTDAPQDDTDAVAGDHRHGDTWRGAVARLHVRPRVSQSSNGGGGDAWSTSPDLSADGRWTAFESEATNLVAGDTNHVRDVFVRDNQSGAVVRVSVSSFAAEEPTGRASIPPSRPTAGSSRSHRPRRIWLRAMSTASATSTATTATRTPTASSTNPGRPRRAWRRRGFPTD